MEKEFRAWDTEQHKMHYFNMQEIRENMGFEYGIPDNLRPLSTEDIFSPVMEHTGISVFGAKIYEEDIIEYDDTMIGGDKGIGKVIWCDDLTLVPAPGYYLEMPDYSIMTHFPLGTIEIIGNEYETPDWRKL